MARPLVRPLLLQLHRLARQPAGGAPSDAQLLARYSGQGDQDAFAELLRRHGPMVRGVCERGLDHRQDAEDAFQATFLVLARKAGSLRAPEALPAWLHGVAARVARKARARRPASLQPPTEVPASAEGPDQEAGWREVRRVLDEELARLSASYRAVLVLCYLDGRTRDEAARQLGWSLGTLKRRLEHGRRLLRDRLARRGVGPAGLAAAVLTADGLTAPVSAAATEAVLRSARGGASAAVRALAAAGLPLVGGGSWKALAGLVVSAGLLLGAFAGPPTERRPAEVPTGPAAGDPPRRADRAGEPLPEGVIARLGTLRLRSPGPIRLTAVSPDGRTLATLADGSKERLVTLWDRASGREIRRWPVAQLGKVYAALSRDAHLAFTPDGQGLAVSGPFVDGGVWDVTGKRRFAFEGDRAVVSPDGKLLAVAAIAPPGDEPRPWHLTLRDTATGKVIRDLEVNGYAGDLTFADARTVAFRAEGPPVPLLREVHWRVQLLDVATGKEKMSFDLRSPHVGRTVPNFAFSPDGLTLTTADNETGVRQWDVPTGKLVRHWQQVPTVRELAFTADGRRMVWVGSETRDAERRVWLADTDGKQPPRAVGGALTGFGPPASFSADGRVLLWVASAGILGPHALQVRDTLTGKDLCPLDAHSARVESVHFTPDARAVVSVGGGTALVWDRATGRLLRRFAGSATEGERPVAVLPGGRLLLAGAADRSLRVREAVSGREVLKLEGRLDPAEVAIAADGRSAALTARGGPLRLFDLTTGKQRRAFASAGWCRHLALSRDGRYLSWFEMRADGRPASESWALFDTASGEPVRLPGRASKSLDASTCFSGDGRLLIECDSPEGHRVRRWELATGKELPALTEAHDLPLDLHGSTDGRFVALWGADLPPAEAPGPDGPLRVAEAAPAVRLWDTFVGPRPRRFAPAGGSRSLRFSADGRMLLGGHDGTIHLWEVAIGRDRGPLRGHFPSSGGTGDGCLALSPDGRALASGGSDTQVLLWDLTGRSPDGRWQPARHSPERLRQLWATLLDGEARSSYRAMWELTADPEAAVAFVKEQLPPAAEPTERIRQLLLQLDHPRFAVRERAGGELARLSEFTEPFFRATLAAGPSAEVRRRIGQLRGKRESGDGDVAYVRAARAVELLEHIATPEARRLLTAWAGGAGQAWLTREAQFARKRLGE